MNTESKNNIELEFSPAATFSDPILIKMTLPDGSKQVIGHVLQDWENEDAPVLYVSIGENGEEICPPTDDWTAVEQAFARYARQYVERQHEARQDKAASRVNEISGVREQKGRNKTIGISK
ncbi:MAG TPA: hypothetical protein VK809_02630 [Bacteroidia bacterium]|jgi:hypothetical protein|nr:hypothetical protein [Bacteroidia bacterium]